LARVAVDPETAGLCGCYQFVAVWRERQELRQGKVVATSEEYSFYATSLARDQHHAQALLEILRGHWDACGTMRGHPGPGNPTLQPAAACVTLPPLC
jgi:hypothetical protein